MFHPFSMADYPALRVWMGLEPNYHRAKPYRDGQVKSHPFAHLQIVNKLSIIVTCFFLLFFFGPLGEPRETCAGVGSKCKIPHRKAWMFGDSGNHHTMMPPWDPFICDHNVEFLYSIKNEKYVKSHLYKVTKTWWIISIQRLSDRAKSVFLMF